MERGKESMWYWLIPLAGMVVAEVELEPEGTQVALLGVSERSRDVEREVMVE